MAFICGWGGYIPIYRIKTEEIARVWGEEKERIEKGLGIIEKAVANVDEDSVTIAVEASKIALKRAGIEGKKVGAIFMGSESHPYVVKSSGSIIGEAIEATPIFHSADLEFACKAGTTGMQIVNAMIDAGKIEYGLAIGADTAQGRPGDALEYSAGSGGAAFVLGKEGVVKILDTVSYITDTPDFWRREGQPYPSHGGRFTGEPAYFKHIFGSVNEILSRNGMKITDFSHVIFHQPNKKFPLVMAKKLGVKEEQMKYSILVDRIGNTYSGSSMIALANVLDNAKPGELILLASFGSGAGSDAFIFEVMDGIEEKQKEGKKVIEFVERRKYIDYATYVKIRRKLKR